MKENSELIFKAMAEHNKKLIPKELLDKFKGHCADQLIHNPDSTFLAEFKRLKNVECLTFGQAAAIAPFMVYAP